MGCAFGAACCANVGASAALDGAAVAGHLVMLQRSQPRAALENLAWPLKKLATSPASGRRASAASGGAS